MTAFTEAERRVLIHLHNRRGMDTRASLAVTKTLRPGDVDALPALIERGLIYGYDCNDVVRLSLKGVFALEQVSP